MPGSTHYGYYIISYEFVYVGNRHGKKIYVFKFNKINTMINKNICTIKLYNNFFKFELKKLKKNLIVF